MTTTLRFRDPTELHLHPLQKNLPDPDKQSPEWLSFVEGFMAMGPDLMPPLIVTKEGLVMDGGRRWRAAKQLQWDEVPCIERPEAETAELMVSSLLGQRHWTKDARLYMILKLMPEFCQSAESRRLGNLRRGVKNGQKPLIFPKVQNEPSESIDDLCHRLGTNRTAFLRTRRVHELFAEHPQFKLDFEPKLLTGELSLWNVESAIKGALADQSKRTEGLEKGQLELFKEGLGALAKSIKAWNRFDANKQTLALEEWRKTAATMPLDLRRKMADVLNELD